jgi:hypothetical protein
MYLSRIALVQLDPFVPLVDVVGVLPQQDTVQQERPSGYQLLEAGQPELQVNVIWKRQSKDTSQFKRLKKAYKK